VSGSKRESMVVDNGRQSIVLSNRGSMMQQQPVVTQQQPILAQSTVQGGMVSNMASSRIISNQRQGAPIMSSQMNSQVVRQAAPI